MVNEQEKEKKLNEKRGNRLAGRSNPAAALGVVFSFKAPLAFLSSPSFKPSLRPTLRNPQPAAVAVAVVAAALNTPSDNNLRTNFVGFVSEVFFELELR
jgi:hypothetical protein